MIRPRRASGAASCSDVLQPIAVSVAVKPTTASSAPAGQKARVTESPRRPAQATPTAPAITVDDTPRALIAPSESPAVIAPTPSIVIRKPKPSEPRPSTSVASSGTYTLKLNTQKLTMTWSPSTNRTAGVRVT